MRQPKRFKLPGVDMRTAVLPRMQGIYQITCLITGERYIGSSVDMEKRWREHLTAMLRPNNPEFARLSNRYLVKAATIHGVQHMSFQILEFCFAMSAVEMEVREYELINRLNPEFNIKREI